MDIVLTNTLGKKKEVFTPQHKDWVGLYLCGPTVYDFATIGNFRTYTFGDLIHRVLLYSGYTVKYVQNITDVGHLVSDADDGEDKIEKRARKSGKTAWEVAKYFEELYWKDTDRLNILRPTISCRATEHIKEQIEMVRVLEQKGFTYPTTDGIYFDTNKQSDYGKLAGLDIHGLKEGARVEVNIEKKNVTDFALWKFAPAGQVRQMEWESHWGLGFPGWHIECSAMSIKYLGEPFDIHAGAIDLIPVHHTNEVAQNEAVYGQRTVNYWMHGGFLNVDGGRMGKSLGNAYRVQDLVDKGFDPLAFRYLTFLTHYRQSLNFTWEALGAADVAYKKLLAYISLHHSETGGEIITEYEREFHEAINDDINIPRALGVMWTMIRDSKQESKNIVATLTQFDKVLGLGLDKIVDVNEVLSPELLELQQERDHARENKDWKLADEIRGKIESLGYIIKDCDKGSKIVAK